MATRRGRFRTKLCRNFALGHCPQGEKCNYIHASPESIQTNIVDPFIQSSLSHRSSDDQVSSTAFSPQLWPTLSPVTNASSDHFGYNWSNTTTVVDNNPSASRIKYRPLSWRTTLCRHFLKNRGWCPLNDECNYIHDLTLADFAKDDVRFSSRRSSSTANTKQPERGKAGTKHSHCWAYIQGLCHVQDCQYLHPVAAHMFAAHTPCLAWPNCRRGPLCPYKHPDPYISTSPEASPVQQPAALQPPPPPPPPQPDMIPRGAVPYKGMYYFNVPQPQPPAPSLLPPLALPPPSRLQPPVLFTHPWEAGGWQVAFSPPAPVPLPLSFRPMAMNMTPPAWHVPMPPPVPIPAFADAGNPGLLPRMFSSQAAAAASMYNITVSEPPLLPPPAALTYSNDIYDATATEASAAQRPPSFSAAPAPAPAALAATENDFESFPYEPPKYQRAGHAKRVSVTIRSKEDLDALALDTSSRSTSSGGSGSSHGRLPWQTHAGGARRSWAPSSSSLRTAEPTPPPVLYGM